MKNARGQHIAPEELLVRYDLPVRDLANRLRALVKRTLPDAVEKVMPGWGLIGYRIPSGKSTAYVGYIQPCSDHVHLGFEYGILLDDPDKVLEGKGTQVRYLSVRRVADIRSRAFRNLLLQAARTSTAKNKHALLKLEQQRRSKEGAG